MYRLLAGSLDPHALQADIWREIKVDIEHEEVAAHIVRQSTQQEYWKCILLGAIGLLVFERYVYNRRVYL